MIVMLKDEIMQCGYFILLKGLIFCCSWLQNLKRNLSDIHIYDIHKIKGLPVNFDQQAVSLHMFASFCIMHTLRFDFW